MILGDLRTTEWRKIEPKIVPVALASSSRQKRKTVTGRWFGYNFSVGVVGESDKI